MVGFERHRPSTGALALKLHVWPGPSNFFFILWAHYIIWTHKDPWDVHTQRKVQGRHSEKWLSAILWREPQKEPSLSALYLGLQTKHEKSVSVFLAPRWWQFVMATK